MSETVIWKTLGIPKETIRNIIWIDNSNLEENTKTFMLNHMFYMELIEDFTTYKLHSKCALHEHPDKFKTCYSFCSKILKVNPNISITRLQAAVAANLKTSISKGSLLQIIKFYTVQLSYVFKCKSANLHVEPFYPIK